MAGMIWVWGSTSFAGASSVGLYGTEAQKASILPRIAAGRLRLTIGCTKPGGGTDLLGAMTTRVTKVDGGWLVNGAKTWCTSAHVSDYVLLLARTSDHPERKSRGETLFLMPTDAAGITLHTSRACGRSAPSTWSCRTSSFRTSWCSASPTRRGTCSCPRSYLPRDPGRCARGRAGLPARAAGLRQGDRRVPGAAALRRRHRHVAVPDRARRLPTPPGWARPGRTCSCR